MLRELIEYYDCIISQPESDFIPDGFTRVPNVAYKIVLTHDGKLKTILPNTYTETFGKKQKEIGYDEIFPFRYSVPSIASETIECRGKYLFGLEWDKKNEKFVISEKAYEENKKTNTEFLHDLSSPVIDAYRLFLENWNPAEETENPILLSVGKNFDSAKYIIVVEDSEAKEMALHEDSVVKAKWENFWQNRFAFQKEADEVKGQCAVSGEIAPIARIHNNLSGIAGGLATGVNLVCFKTSAFWSYGKQGSYNSSVSTAVMEKYTKVFNYLTSSKKHKRMLDDMTLLFWANTREKESPYLDEFIFELWDVEPDLESTVLEIGKGKTKEWTPNENIEFCIVGIKPNSSRLAIKLFEKDNFGHMMARIGEHQRDLRLSEDDKQLSLWGILRTLKSPKSDNDTIPPDLSAKLLTAILHGTPYPEYLLQTIVRRAKIDKDDKKNKFYAISSTRARILKACLVRSNYYKGDEYMLDSTKQTVAFRCGRLFAVLEKIQTDALGEINATIKDKFFTSACSTPDLVFARLIKLAQPHLAKLDKGSEIYYDKLLQEILSEIGVFPKALSLQKQGDFILGYYQQKQKLYEKRIAEGEE
ncbi:MAG: type I-C CRISPR-associated protein Cas8c/Csd1 [Clostridia bacterium]|nr:type I-C CRISPR-associated protein Cas8c/Csd1 [Clostridia bacterium]